MQAHRPSTGTVHDYRCEIARDRSSEALATALTDRVYEQKLGLERPEDRTLLDGPYTSQHRVLLVRDASRPVATLTLQSVAFDSTEVGSRAALPLELESTYRLESLGLCRGHVAEVRRMAVEPGHPGAVQCLYAEAVRISLEYDIRHWLGLVEAQGELASDASIVFRVLVAHGVALVPPALEPCEASALFDEARAERRTAFSNAQLQRVPLPIRIRSFSRLFRARAVSVPTLHPHYRRLVVPMLAHLEQFRGLWLQ